ncbi:hypothetical protein F5Y15DRAFT_429510 [Xylariaceae sp. FL0016]|nr:hypothetical protein F5Y15DRAFT_429510 [Xylariaceae sp. FL0016]
MIVGLTAGIAFALGHHQFYHELDQVSLVLAVGGAYWQVFWRTLSSKPVCLFVIDSLADLLGSLPSLFDIAALRVSSILICLAAIFWLIPLATIFAPPTLTVAPADFTSYENHSLPAINFETAGFATITYANPGAGANPGNVSAILPIYGGPSPPLSRLVMATAMRGELPNFSPPTENSSYRLDFNGPRVQCKPAPTDILKSFDSADCQFLVQNNSECRYSYLAWPPTKSDIVPYNVSDMIDNSLPLHPFTKGSSDSYLGAYDYGPATLFIAADARVYEGTWTVLNCSLRNSTCTFEFDFQSISQRISLLQTRDNNEVGVDWLDDSESDFENPDSIYNSRINYQALMECLGRLLAGSVYDNFGLETLFQTGIALQSDLAYTKEPFPIYNFTLVSREAYNITVLDALKSPNFNRPLADVVEEMFMNMTLALFSKDAFLRYDVEPTNVTVHSMLNIYVYSSRYLLLAYGLAIAFSMIVVVYASVGLWHSQASYSNKFSTIVRTTCRLDVCSHLEEEDRTGTNPLPQRLKDRMIHTGGGGMALNAETGESPVNQEKDISAVTESSTMLSQKSHYVDPCPYMPWESANH